MDAADLKHYMHFCNIHNTHPIVFKAVNDAAVNSDYIGTWTQQKFRNFFMDHVWMNKITGKVQKPSMNAMVLLFEWLDERKQGFLDIRDFRSIVKKLELIKRLNFDLDEYKKQQTEKGVVDEVDETRDKQLNDWLKQFDLKGDGKITPALFFNMVMLMYE